MRLLVHLSFATIYLPEIVYSISLINIGVARKAAHRYRSCNGPLAQLDRALPSEGRGQRFESSKDRHSKKNH